MKGGDGKSTNDNENLLMSTSSVGIYIRVR